MNAVESWPTPDASRAELDLWWRRNAIVWLCTGCGLVHVRIALDAPRALKKSPRCAACADDKPHEAPPVRNGPSIVCNGCGVIRVPVGVLLCEQCTACMEARCQDPT